MNNQDRWKPSKFVYRNGKLIASRDPKEVHVGSLLVSDLIAITYDDNLRQHARGYLLDLGCGKVPLFEAYKAYVSRTMCVDWGNTLHKNEHLDLEHDLTRPLPFEDGTFDTLILSDVLEHIPQPEALFKEMARVLAPQGKILMNTPFYYWLHERPHDYYRYTEFALRRFVEISGLQLVKIEVIGGAPEILADIMAKLAMKIPFLGRPFSSLIQYITHLLVKSRFGKSVSNKTKPVFPFGYFLIAQKTN
jgi:SAM-dependent methyltransferase